MSGVEDDILLEILAIQGRGLPNKDFFKKQDPFLVFEIGQFSHRTKVDKNGGTQPEWNHRIRFERLKQPVSQILKVKCFDDEWKRKEQFIGECAVDLDPIFQAGECDGWFKLYDRGAPAGEVYLELTFHNKSKLEKKFSQKVSTTPVVKVNNTVQTPIITHSLPSQESTNQTTLANSKPEVVIHTTSNASEVPTQSETTFNNVSSTPASQDPTKRIDDNQQLVNSVTMQLEDVHLSNLSNKEKINQSVTTDGPINITGNIDHRLPSDQNVETPADLQSIPQNKEHAVRPNLPPIPQDASLRSDSLNQAKAPLNPEHSYSDTSVSSSIIGYYQPTTNTNQPETNQQNIAQLSEHKVDSHNTPITSEIKQSPPPSTHIQHQAQQHVTGIEHTKDASMAASYSNVSSVLPQKVVSNDSTQTVNTHHINQSTQGSSLAQSSVVTDQQHNYQHPNAIIGHLETHPSSGSPVENHSLNSNSHHQNSHDVQPYSHSNQEPINTPQQKVEVHPAHVNISHTKPLTNSEQPPRTNSYPSQTAQPVSQYNPPVKQEYTPLGDSYPPQSNHPASASTVSHDSISASEVYGNVARPTSQGYPPQTNPYSPSVSNHSPGSIPASEVLGSSNKPTSSSYGYPPSQSGTTPPTSHLTGHGYPPSKINVVSNSSNSNLAHNNQGYSPNKNSYPPLQSETTSPISHSVGQGYPPQNESYPPSKTNVASSSTISNLAQNNQGYPPNKSSYPPSQSETAPPISHSAGQGYPPQNENYPPSKTDATISSANSSLAQSNQGYPPNKISYPPQQEATSSSHIYPPRQDSYPPPNANAIPGHEITPSSTHIYHPQGGEYPPLNTSTVSSMATSSRPSSNQGYPPNKTSYPSHQEVTSPSHIYPPRLDSYPPPQINTNLASKPSSNNHQYPPASVNESNASLGSTSQASYPPSNQQNYPPTKMHANDDSLASAASKTEYPPSNYSNVSNPAGYPPATSTSNSGYPSANSNAYPPTHAQGPSYGSVSSHQKPYPPNKSNESPYGSVNSSKPYPPTKDDGQVYPPLNTNSYEAYPPANNQKPYPPAKEDVQGYPPQKTNSFDTYPSTNVYSPPPAAPYPPPQVKPVNQNQHNFPTPIQTASNAIEGGFVQPYVQSHHNVYPPHQHGPAYPPQNFPGSHADSYSPSTAFPTPQPWTNVSQASFAGAFDNNGGMPPPLPNKPNDMPTHYGENLPPPLPSRPSYNSPYPNPSQLPNNNLQYQPNFNNFGYPAQNQNNNNYGNSGYSQGTTGNYNENYNSGQQGPPVVPLQQGSLGKKKKNKYGFLNF